MAEQPSYQDPVSMRFGWYGQTPVTLPVTTPPNIHRIDQFDGLTRSADGMLEALAKVQTQQDLIVVKIPWRNFRNITNAREVTGDAWDDAEEQYRKSMDESKEGWFTWFGHCLGLQYRHYVPCFPS
jgi:hypothetical protein